MLHIRCDIWYILMIFHIWNYVRILLRLNIKQTYFSRHRPNNKIIDTTHFVIAQHFTNCCIYSSSVLFEHVQFLLCFLSLSQHSFRPNFLATAHQLKEEGFKVSFERLFQTHQTLYWTSGIFSTWPLIKKDLLWHFVLDVMLSPLCSVALCYWSYFCLAVC